MPPNAPGNESQAGEGGFQGDDDLHEKSTMGGALRSISRAVVRLFRLEKVVIGSIPRRVPAKTMSKGADTIGQLFDVTSELYNAQGEIKYPLQGKNNSLYARLHKILHLCVTAAPPVVKSAVLGGVLFSCFETMEADFYERCYISDGSSRVFYPTALSLVAGGCSGCLHGMCSTFWDGAAITVSGNTGSVSYLQRHLLGNMISHTFIHGSLFGSYELSKRGCLTLIGLHTEHDDTSRIEGALCVLAGGIVAGTLSEVLSEVLLPLEEKGLKAYVHERRNNELKRFRMVKINVDYLRRIGPSVLSTVLGFVAYEFAKDVHLNMSDGEVE